MYKNTHISFSSFMPTITSYFGFLLAASTITPALFIGLSKIRLIQNENELNEQFIKRNVSARFQVFHSSFPCQLSIEIHGQFGLIFRDRYYLYFFHFQTNQND
nr:cytochrome b6/f complex subunit VI [Pachysandra axillaris]WEQ92441.1 cytochrome b6/f complex subunit VI [Pachysandra axillaris]